MESVSHNNTFDNNGWQAHYRSAAPSPVWLDNLKWPKNDLGDGVRCKCVVDQAAGQVVAAHCLTASNRCTVILKYIQIHVHLSIRCFVLTFVSHPPCAGLSFDRRIHLLLTLHWFVQSAFSRSEANSFSPATEVIPSSHGWDESAEKT